jgi:hypothetical protein
MILVYSNPVPPYGSEVWMMTEIGVTKNCRLIILQIVFQTREVNGINMLT